MKELDLLKKHWNSTQNFPKITADEIRKMIHKKSSSIVMWIFIISIIEFTCLNLASYFFINNDVDDDTPKGTAFTFMIDYIDYVSISISIIFIILFYNNYRKICTKDSTKSLMKQIIKTKKTVNYYIYCNLVVILVGLLVTIFDIITNQGQVNLAVTLISIGIVLIICSLFLFIIWLYYKVIYGFLIKKLMNNYKELEKIDFE
ncbi:hypothetical protein [Myroides injenensis]|uniref:hypothetical protein n=1 Tax=Myroides injenensis TaxID=1183151 RepID=UPI0002880683|nr:hypothetical protein [Myroides injenensis]